MLNIQLIVHSMKSLEATISIWGEFTSVRIPSAFVQKSGLKIGQKVRLESASDGTMTIRPIIEKPKLEDLLARITPDNLPDEADTHWGKPVGSEQW